MSKFDSCFKDKKFQKRKNEGVCRGCKRILYTPPMERNGQAGATRISGDFLQILDVLGIRLVKQFFS